METLTTQGITVKVEIFYEEEHSRPREQKYIFAYRITIENHSNETVQLLRRYWQIRDSSGWSREVEGEGVIGQQPVLEPGESHQYISWCPISTDIGKMSGYYTMIRSADLEEFIVRIPDFKLISPFKLN
jgi:ApaG protein